MVVLAFHFPSPSLHKVRTIIASRFRNRSRLWVSLTPTKDTGSYSHGNAGRSGNARPDWVPDQLASTSGYGALLFSGLLERVHVNARGSTQGQPGIQPNSLLLGSCKRRYYVKHKRGVIIGMSVIQEIFWIYLVMILCTYRGLQWAGTFGNFNFIKRNFCNTGFRVSGSPLV